MKILVINGPNLNLLGKREKTFYGELTLEEIENIIKNNFPEDDFEFVQSNSEGEIIDKLHNCEEENFEGVIINPGGYAHTSIAIRDALEILKILKIEVHLSNLSKREDFRQTLITASACDGYISGFKEKGYLSAIYLLHSILQK